MQTHQQISLMKVRIRARSCRLRPHALYGLVNSNVDFLKRKIEVVKMLLLCVKHHVKHGVI